MKGARPTANAVMPAQVGLVPAGGGEMIPTFELRVIMRAEEQWQTPGKREWIVQIKLSPKLPKGGIPWLLRDPDQ